MIRWFRRRRPVQAPARLPLPDVLAISAWRLTEHAWNNLTDQERAWYRGNLTKARIY